MAQADVPPIDLLNPEEQTRILTMVSSAVESGNLRAAGELSHNAIRRGMRHPILFNARGLAFQAGGRHQQAIQDFRASLQLTPKNALVLNAIAVSLLSLEKLMDAKQTLDEAIAADPTSAPAYFRRGLVNAMLGDHEAAESEYNKAIEIDPNYTDALANLASIAARQRDESKALALAGRALALNPKNATASYALAILDNAQRRYPEAEQRLHEILKDPSLHTQARAGALGLLGDTLDGQGRYAEAFAAYEKENAELRQAHARYFAENRAVDATGHIISYFETTAIEPWRSTHGGELPQDGPREHVFLLGFMRSGTTLLEQVLGSNPDIVALEEKGNLNGFGATYMTSVEALNRLANISADELHGYRSVYWDRVRGHAGDLQGKIFVDKQPLNTVRLPLIAKMFPKAKILFALRDPRDVVFSCYRRHFRVNSTMFEFLSLEDTAHFYSQIMRLAEISREKLAFDILDHRYEDMVVDFEKSVRAVCDFIGLEWSDKMRDFDKHGPKVDLRSPSAIQVQRPLYSEGMAHWRRYKDQLAPIYPILEPWVRKFGYPVD